MKTMRDTTTSGLGVGEGAGRVLGWLSGLGLLVVPVFVAGVLATAGGVLEALLSSELSEPQAWDAERTFPWLYIAALVGCLGGITYGCLRIPGYRRGALPGAAIAVVVLSGIFVLGLVVA